jgi:SWI/SNF related-matrix-associated actin-dependent regulator of chromatin subfamily C
MVYITCRQIDPESRPAALAPPFTGHFRVILDTPRGLQSLHPGTRPTHPGAPTVNGTQKPPTIFTTPASLELRSNIYQTTAKASRPVSGTEAETLANGAAANGVTRAASSGLHTCDTCGADCTAMRYHSLKDKKFEICAPCYLDGRFPSTMFSGDFVKLTSAASNVSHGSGVNDDWTDQEILLLLEGVEMYDDDWSKIEEHVGTRSSQQCIRKFLELPIEDSYLNTEGSMGLLRFGRIPFEQADNPVMSVVAFLAGAVAPGVAAEAAKTALHELTDGSKADVDEKAGNTDDSTDKDKQKETEINEQRESTDDKMDEDVDDEDGASANKPGTSPRLSESMSVDTGPKKPSPTLPHSKVVRAADLALKASAKAAKALADAEDAQIRSSLASLIKLTLTKLELKMSQFEELEDILEEERRGLESAKMALLNERLGLKKMIDTVRSEIARNGGMVSNAMVASLGLGTTGQGTMVNEVQQGMTMDGDMGPVNDGSMLQLS